MDVLFTELTWGQTGFLMIFVLVFALFYSLALTSLFNIKLKPSWLLFVLFPILILITTFIDRRYVLMSFLGTFAFLFVLFITGGIYNTTKEQIKLYKLKRKKESKSAVIIYILKNTIFGIVSIALFFINPAILITLLLFISVFKYFVFPNSEDQFLRLQASLPTSKIRSLAMGLVEIKGVTKQIEPLISRLGKKECIGYIYTVEKTSTDNGKTSYTLISSETICNPFIVSDETGEVNITAKDIELEWLPVDKRYTSNGKRYSQHLLVKNQKVLLIGKANTKDNKTFIERETLKDIYTLAPITKILNWNRFKPLLDSLFLTLGVFFTLVALVLLADITTVANITYINFDVFYFKLEHNSLVIPSNFFPYQKEFIAQPILLVAWASFGVPLLIFIIILIPRLISKSKLLISLLEDILSIVFTSLGITWIVGFIMMILLLFLGTPGIKMYFIWLLLLLTSLVFVASNNNLITKYLEEKDK